MRFDLITIFPTIFDSYFNEGMIRKAKEQKIIEIHSHNLRDFSKDKWGKVDEIPYGGGAGMVMTPQPLFDAIKEISKKNSGPVIYLSPKGEILTNSKAIKWAKEWQKYKPRKIDQLNKIKPNSKNNGVILICGRYEGIDQRIIDLAIDKEISIGKYILTGGELAAMVLIDSVIRFIPGILGDENSHQEETFSRKLKGKKEYPHYTRPENFMDIKVPDILLSGHHAKINKWREENLS